MIILWFSHCFPIFILWFSYDYPYSNISNHIKLYKIIFNHRINNWLVVDLPLKHIKPVRIMGFFSSTAPDAKAGPCSHPETHGSEGTGSMAQDTENWAMATAVGCNLWLNMVLYGFIWCNMFFIWFDMLCLNMDTHWKIIEKPIRKIKDSGYGRVKSWYIILFDMEKPTWLLETWNFRKNMSFVSFRGNNIWLYKPIFGLAKVILSFSWICLRNPPKNDPYSLNRFPISSGLTTRNMPNNHRQAANPGR
jgi:hypothetical protein